MLVKYIDSNYIIETLQKPSWGEVEEPDFYITMASNRVKALIFPSEQGDPNNLASYNEEQQEAIKLATAIYTLWYFDTNYDFTNGSVSVNFGGVSMSESKTYNGEMVLPNVFDILKQANLIPTTETFIFNNTSGSFDNVNINPEAFKDLQQEMERQADNNIRQDGEIVKIYDRLSRVPTNEEQEHLKLEVEEIQKEQEVQNTNIQANTNKTTDLQNQITENTEEIAAINEEVSTNKTDIANLGNKVNANETAIQTNTNKIQENKNNITILDGRLLSVSGLLNQTIEGLRTFRPFKFIGVYDPLRDYMINEMVSYNNVFYLSLEDNNRTEPPNDKWIVMENFQQVDLSEYPTKLEVEAIKNNLQQSITSNTNNIVDLGNRTTNLETNSLSKTTTTPQTIASQITFTQTDMVLKFNSGTNNSAYLAGYKSGNQRVWYFGKGSSTSDNFIIGADRGVIKLEPSTHVDVSNKKIINVADPTANKDAATKAYVDNQVNTNTTNITTIRNNYLDKTATGNQQIAASSLYVQNQLVVNQPYNPILTPSADLHVSGQGYIENIEADNATFNTSVIVPTPTQNDHAANKAYVDNAIANSGSAGSGGSIDTSNFVTLNTNQTIRGQKTFTNRIFANGGITNLPDPTNTQEAATKAYVDNKTSLYTMFSSNTIYNNLQKITTRLFDNSAVDYLKPLTVSFTRTNTSGTDYGSYTFQIQYGIGENNFVVGSNLYYDRSKTYGQLGDWVALTITPTYIQVQCWNGGDRIKNIKVQGWKRV